MATIRSCSGKYQVLVRTHGVSMSKIFIKKVHAQQWVKATEIAVKVYPALMGGGGRLVQDQTAGAIYSKFKSFHAQCHLHSSSAIS